jgi:hypothetical protein
MRFSIALCTVLSAIVCGACTGLGNGSSPTSPTSARVINVTGDLTFGQVTVGDSQTKVMTILNTGTSTLTISGITGPCGSSFTVGWSNGAISAGSSQAVRVRFAPTAAQTCTGVLTVNGDQTSGTSTIAVNATAVAGYSRDLSGRWRGTVGADTIITLTETGGSALSGTFDSVSLKGTVSGSVGNTGQVTLTVTVPGFQPFTLSGQADAAGNTISGQVNGSGFQNASFTLRRI